MGKKGNWFVAVRKAFSHENKEKKHEKKTSKSKKKWKFGKEKSQDPNSTMADIVLEQRSPPSEEVKFTEAENKQTKHAYSAELATAVAAEAAVAAAQAAAEVVRLMNVARYSGKSKEEVAAIKIQTAFRGYLARRALRALRGLVRLKTLLHGQSVKRQVSSTLRCMQTLAHVQSQVHARRIRMLEENQALQRQIQQKCEKELEKLRLGEAWDDSLQSKEQIEAKLLSKQEAAIRRERALAYAFSHQQTLKNSSRSANLTFMDPKNPHWGWSWLERWMAARPWETRSMTEKELNNDHASIKSSTTHNTIAGEISKAYARRELTTARSSPAAQKLSRPANRKSPSTPPSKPASIASGAVKLKSPRGGRWTHDDDSRSMLSIQSEQYRRHSIAGSSVRDDESLASSPAVPSYMAPTQSAKAKARLPSPLGVDKYEISERGSIGSAKKRLHFPASPAGPRRHSSPAKVDSSSNKGIDVQT